MATTSENQLIDGDPSVELSSHRTALAFDRTAYGSDRTLMAAVRTSLSLISFGFTIFTFFHLLNEEYLGGKLPSTAPRNFGFALIVLGVVLLIVGILNHWHDGRVRRERRRRLYDSGLLHHPEKRKVSSAEVIAILLLIVGLMAMVSVGTYVGPF